MQADTSNVSECASLNSPFVVTPAAIDSKPEDASEHSLAYWHLVQNVLLAVSFVLVALLLFVPDLGLHILWNVLIPAAPALIVVAPGLWRNVCPMATLSLLPQRLGISRQGVPTHRLTTLLSMASLIALFLVVPYRHLSLDTNGPMSALMLVAAGIIALSMGGAFKWRSGWCTTLCPIHPVERLYGIVPATSFSNARCAQCEQCTTPCPDSTRFMSPAVTVPSSLATTAGHVMIGGFVGFVWGWYQIPDYVGNITASHYLSAYLWPFAGALVSLTVYAILLKWAVTTKKTRNTLIKMFAAAAVSTYYWFRIPALVGLGPNYGTGMLYDLTAILPAWSEDLSHIVTTLFFIWFMLLRETNGTSWMARPAV